MSINQGKEKKEVRKRRCKGRGMVSICALCLLAGIFAGLFLVRESCIGENEKAAQKEEPEKEEERTEKEETEKEEERTEKEETEKREASAKEEIAKGKALRNRISVKAPSFVLMEAHTGTVIAAAGEETERMPASVTKIMTLLLIYEAMEEGKYTKEDVVTVSAHAAGMGGSQIYLEEGEQQTVEALVKSIVIASANDAATAMAEFTAGSEEAFVKQMNEKAGQLGLEHTKFANCCGLDTSLGKNEHYSCALDIARMSRELLNHYPQVSEYATTWMDTILHHTRRGESEFGLTNTNKLIRYYPGITGLKTGYTKKSGFCLSASATRDGMSLIAVVMGEASSKERFEDAAALLDYGFAGLCLYQDPDKEEYTIPVRQGKTGQLPVRPKTETVLLLPAGQSGQIEKKVVLEKELAAPVKKGTVAGRLEYYSQGSCVKTIPLVTAEGTEKAGFSDYFKQVLRSFFLIFQNPT